MLVLIYKTFLIKAVARSMEVRYRFLEESLAQLSNLTVDRLKRLTKVIGLLYRQSDLANQVFSFYIFSGVLLTCFGCLSSISFLLTAGKLVSGSKFGLFNIVFACASRLVTFLTSTSPCFGLNQLFFRCFSP